MLGCGTSSGVPRIGGDWGSCNPENPRNARTRPSILIESATTRILVDTSPDLRAQLLAAGVGQVDAVIWTHDHADHCHGIDDLRQIFHARAGPVPGYARAHTIASLNARFGYIFTGNPAYPAVSQLRDLPDAMTIGDIEVDAIDMPHGPITSAGLRFELEGRSIGYATDFSRANDQMMAFFAELDIWVIDALRVAPHPTHANLEMTLETIAQCKPSRAFLTHMDQSMDYDRLCGQLPEHIRPGHDGLEITL